MNRRDVFRYLTIGLSGLMALGLAVPGLAYVLDPLRRRGKPEEGEGEGMFRALTRLSQLPVGVPQSFPIIEAREDAWVKYPPEPVGAVWLIRHDDGADEPVVAFSAECPHLGCAINLTADRQAFLCPCHTSAFDFEGRRTNDIPPRGMDRLDVALSDEPDPLVRVRFQRFRTMSKEKIPLV